MVFDIRVPGVKVWFGSEPPQTIRVQGDYYRVKPDGTLEVYSKQQQYKTEWLPHQPLISGAMSVDGLLLNSAFGQARKTGESGETLYTYHVPISGQFNIIDRASFVPGAWLSVRQEGW